MHTPIIMESGLREKISPAIFIAGDIWLDTPCRYNITNYSKTDEIARPSAFGRWSRNDNPTQSFTL
jgi:hypothetical protein